MSNFNAALVRISSGALVFGLSTLFGVPIVPLVVLGVLMLLDYASGLSSAWIGGRLSSKKSIVGILKKVAYLAVIAVGVACDYVIRSGFSAAGYEFSTGCAVSLIIVIWLIINEMISILENISEMGVPVPTFLLAVVQKLKISAERSKKDGDNEK